MWSAILGGIKGVAEALATFLRLRERSKNEEAGANAEKLKQHEAANDAREKMAGVDPGGKSDAVDRLRDGSF